jgi:hypothetical protein
MMQVRMIVTKKGAARLRKPAGSEILMPGTKAHAYRTLKLVEPAPPLIDAPAAAPAYARRDMRAAEAAPAPALATPPAPPAPPKSGNLGFVGDDADDADDEEEAAVLPSALSTGNAPEIGGVARFGDGAGDFPGAVRATAADLAAARADYEAAFGRRPHGRWSAATLRAKIAAAAAQASDLP